MTSLGSSITSFVSPLPYLFSQVFKAQKQAKSEGFTDIIYLDSVQRKYLEEASSCNLFIVKVYARYVPHSFLQSRVVRVIF